MLWVFDSVLNSLSLSPILPSMFRLHIYNFWSCLTHFGFVPYCFINLACSLSHFCYPSGTVRVLNFKSLWVKDVKGIDFQTAETAKSVWLSLKGRDSPPSWVWVCAQAVPQHRVGHALHQTQSTPGRHYSPEAPPQATGPPLFPPFSGGSNFASVLDFRRRTTLPLFCGWPGAISRLPDPPPPPPERNKHA